VLAPGDEVARPGAISARESLVKNPIMQSTAEAALREDQHLLDHVVAGKM
jgi:hypothetical protein